MSVIFLITSKINRDFSSKVSDIFITISTPIIKIISFPVNGSIDLIVNNAINLTKNFQNLIDIPALIMNSVAIKFGKQAAEEVGENKGATNEYKTKLEEFLDKYSQALTQLPDYEHYSVEKIRLQNPQPTPAAIGASNPGG